VCAHHESASRHKLLQIRNVNAIYALPDTCASLFTVERPVITGFRGPFSVNWGPKSHLRLPDKEITLGEGEVLHISSGVEHSAVVLEDTLDLDVFSPIREDWLTGKDNYLRK